MNYKVTALKNVTIRANVRTTVPRTLGKTTVSQPVEREEWITLRAGEVRDGLGLVRGIAPSCLPAGRPVTAGGVPMILVQYQNRDLPKEFFALFRLEVLGEGPPDGGAN